MSDFENADFYDSSDSVRHTHETLKGYLEEYISEYPDCESIAVCAYRRREISRDYSLSEMGVLFERYFDDLDAWILEYGDCARVYTPFYKARKRDFDTMVELMTDIFHETLVRTSDVYRCDKVGERVYTRAEAEELCKS